MQLSKLLHFIVGHAIANYVFSEISLRFYGGVEEFCSISFVRAWESCYLLQDTGLKLLWYLWINLIIFLFFPLFYFSPLSPWSLLWYQADRVMVSNCFSQKHFPLFCWPLMQHHWTAQHTWKRTPTASSVKSASRCLYWLVLFWVMEREGGPPTSIMLSWTSGHRWSCHHRAQAEFMKKTLILVNLAH